MYLGNSCCEGRPSVYIISNNEWEDERGGGRCSRGMGILGGMGVPGDGSSWGMGLPGG